METPKPTDYQRVKVERDKLAEKVRRMQDQLEGLNLALAVMDDNAPQLPLTNKHEPLSDAAQKYTREWAGGQLRSGIPAPTVEETWEREAARTGRFFPDVDERGASTGLPPLR